MNDAREQSGSHGTSGRNLGRPASHTLAEWVSFGVSCLLIAGLAAFLVYEIVKRNDAYVVPRIVVRTDAVRQLEAVFILPVEVENTGRRTLRDLEIELTYTPPGNQQPEKKAEKTFDYLGEGAKQTLYFYLDHDPRQVPVHVRPLHYRLD
jgi:uncharacterized protein (TIGR02588 family)